MDKKKNNNIPKKIHYCWFGYKELPDSAKKCIESWKKYCPDYEIICWNEKNLNINKYKFAQSAYEDRRWAFVSDVFRVDIIYEHGGLYFDTDVEVIKNLDDLLMNEAFAGFEGMEYIAFGLGFGAKAKNKTIKEMLDVYSTLDYNKYKEKIEKIASPILFTQIFSAKGLIKNGSMQVIEGFKLYPEDYFAPKNPISRLLNITDNTYSIHHYDASWVSEKEKEWINSLEKNAKEIMTKYPDRVSILIPVYNGTNFMRDAINSALNQTYKNLEIIVINDGSIDETDEIAKSYGNAIRYFSKENGGVSSALNLGLKVATGKFISWLSHDDMYYPEKIEKQVAFLKKYDNDTIAVSNWSIVNENKKIIKYNYLDERLEKYPDCFLAFDRKTWLNGCAMLIPKTIFNKFGIFNIDLKSTQDYDMWFRLSKKVKFKIINEHLLYSRAHAKQGCLTMPNALIDSDLIHSQIIESLSFQNVMDYFNNNIDELLEVFKSFYSFNYKITCSHLLKIIFEYYLGKKDYKQLQKIIQTYLSQKDDFGLKLIDISVKRKEINKKKVLFCSAHWYTGGVERVLSNLMVKLKDDYDITLMTVHTDLKSCIHIPNGITHITVSDEDFYNNYDFLILAFSIILNFDIVVGCMNLFDKMLDFYKLAYKAKLKTIASNHEYYFYPYKNQYFHRFVQKRQECFSYVDAVIWLTNFSAAVYNTYNSNGCLIYNPNTFEIQQNDVKIKTDKIILSVGRFTDPVKRIDRILLCFSKVVKKIPDARLVLVGKCDRKSKILFNDKHKTVNEIILELNLSDKNISFEGEIEDIKEYYTKASLLILASNSEGFPMILNEAACFGTPTVCNSIPGIEDIIIDGENGYIIKQDDLDAMADKVCEILEDNSLRIRLSEGAKKMANRFNINYIASKWDLLFKTLLTGNDKKTIDNILKNNLDFKIENYNLFVNQLSNELNNTFYDNLNIIENYDKVFVNSLKGRELLKILILIILKLTKSLCRNLRRYSLW